MSGVDNFPKRMLAPIADTLTADQKRDLVNQRSGWADFQTYRAWLDIGSPLLKAGLIRFVSKTNSETALTSLGRRVRRELLDAAA